MKLRPVGAEFLYADRRMDGQTKRKMDMTKLIVAFCNFAIVHDRSHARRGTACCETAGTLRVSAEMKWTYRHIQEHRKVTVRFLGW